MPNRSLIAVALLVASCVVLAAGLDATQSVAPAPKTPDVPPRPMRTLPGLQKDGFVQLPNQWRLKPVGAMLEVGDFPVNIAIHPSGKYLAVLHAGFREHEIMIIALNGARRTILSRATLDQTFIGLCFAPDGKSVFASGAELERVHRFEFNNGYLMNPQEIKFPKTARLIIGGIAVSEKGDELFAAGTWGDVVFRSSLEDPAKVTTIALAPPGGKPIVPKVEPKKEEPKAQPKKEEKKGEPPSPPDGRDEPWQPKEGMRTFPYTLLPEPGGKRLFVSHWANACVGVIDLEKNQEVALWATPDHPTEMTLSPDGKALYVACANSTKVSVLDTATGKPLQTITCSMFPTAPVGNTPNSLSLAEIEGKLILFVANADANNLAVFNVTDPKNAIAMGFIPTGWYPTSVRYNPADKRIYVASGKGVSSHENPSGPNPLIPRVENLPEYIAQLFRGTVHAIDFPTPQKMTEYTKTAFACSPLKSDLAPITDNLVGENPIPKKLGDTSPIKHVIYIVKENRTYDQVFGDMPQGNGSPEICIFPENVTPNHHKLAREFVLLDNIYVEGEVSADGHEWSMGAYATDFVEKVWPLTYRGGGKEKIGYPSEGQYDQIERGAGGYLWDRCKEAKVSYRSYGEWINNGKMNADGTFEDCKASVPTLVDHFDPQYRAYDLDYTDVNRAKRFISELKRFEQAGEMPACQIVKLPNDHTFGSRVGKPTPTAMVADNDLALGMIIDGLSRSKFWKDTAVFVIEDDAQNGPDHVDAHRVVALVISPYTKRGFVDSSLYSTSSMLRTMELILNLKPMSQFDAAARPMYHSFTMTPTLTPFDHVVPKIDLNEKNVVGAWGAEWCETPDLTRKEDAVDDLIFNDIIWRSVKGHHSPVPAPIRAAFFRAKVDD